MLRAARAGPCTSSFFHDPMMRETVELYELIARADPARHRRVLRSDDQPCPGADARRATSRAPPCWRARAARLQVNGASETDIANGILRVSQARHAAGVLPRRPRRARSVQPGVARPSGGRARPLARPGRQVRAPRAARDGQGAPRARDRSTTRSRRSRCCSGAHGARRLRRARGGGAEDGAAAGGGRRRSARTWPAGGNALFMLDPFVSTGLEPVVREYGDGRRRRHRDRRGEPLLGRRVGARGQRLQPAPDHPRPAADVLPRRALALAHAASGCPAPRSCPLVNSSKRSWGQSESGARRASPRAATSRARHTLMVTAPCGGPAATRRPATRRSRPASPWWATRTSPRTRSSTSWATARCS